MVFELNLGAIRSAAKKRVATPGDMATLATLTTKPAQSVATVAAVASRHGLARLLTSAANDPAPDLRKPESDPWRVTLAPGTPAATEDKFRAASLALDDDISANGQTTDPERWCWPHSGAMNEREVEVFIQRLERFTSKGMPLLEAERLADKRVLQDRDADDRGLCLECTHLHGKTGCWRCGNGVLAGIAIRAANGQLPSDLICHSQRCAAFQKFQ